MTLHSKFGGSSASRWMNCPGSVALLETIPAKPSSVYAEEGSAAHHLAATCLQQDLHPTHFLGEAFPEFPAFPVTQEMCDAVLVYLEAVTHELAKTADSQLFVEAGFVIDVDCAESGEVFGTNDAMVYHPSLKRLVVFDYKHGVGVSVSAEDNAQLKFYAAGAVFSNPWPLKELILTIVQPRSRDADEVGAVREWPMDPLDLLDFKAEVSEAVMRAKIIADQWTDLTKGIPTLGDTYGRMKAGPWCDKTWCDARVTCPAYHALQFAGTGFENVQIEQVNTDDLPSPRDLTPERLSDIVAAIGRINTWASACQEYLEAQLLSGVAIPGWKVVEKIGRAKWVSAEEQIAAELELMFDIDEALVRPKKLTTIGDVEKLMKQAGATKDDIDSFKLKNTIKESSGLTIAPEGDRRPAINAAERAFGDVQI